MIFTGFLKQEARDKGLTLTSKKLDYHLCYRGKEIKVFDAGISVKKINGFATAWVKHHKDA